MGKSRSNFLKEKKKEERKRRKQERKVRKLVKEGGQK